MKVTNAQNLVNQISLEEQRFLEDRISRALRFLTESEGKENGYVNFPKTNDYYYPYILKAKDALIASGYEVKEMTITKKDESSFLWMDTSTEYSYDVIQIALPEYLRPKKEVEVSDQYKNDLKQKMNDTFGKK